MDRSDQLELSTNLLAKAEQSSHFKSRDKPYDVKSIHPADVDAELAQGWELQKKGKTRAKIRRTKTHDKRLEDRVWCFLYKMGYPYLNGKHFQIDLERDNGSVGKKQIDVFACDDETAFVIECKSREERGRRSLQKDLQETISLQNYIRRSIYKLYEDKEKPKIIWVYATHNIIWSESDLDRANDGGIAIITENELQYYEAFLKHMGHAGRYQILGEFLKGQKIPGMGEIKVPAIKGKIGGEIFYSFVSTPRSLLKISFINHQALNHPDGRPAYQRMISSSRIKDIGKYITTGGYFPTNILANFTEKPRFDFISNKENSDENIKFGWITLPNKYRTAWIIDGQHRLYGYSHLSDEFLDQSLFILAFEKMDTFKEANLFIDINSKQKSVPRSLLVSLLADMRLGDNDPRTALAAIASGIIRTINIDKTSPLNRRFSVAGIPPDETQNLTVSEAVNGITRSGLIGKASKGGVIPGPLSGETDIKTIERSRRILNAYFEKLRAANPERWEQGKSAFISINPGIRAHLMLISEIVRYLSHKKDVDFATLNEEKFSAYVAEVAKPVFDYVKDASNSQIQEKFSRKFGEGGVREYLYNLFQIIHATRDDFGSEEFQRWSSQKASDRVGDANNAVMRLSEKIIDCILVVLKRVHGERRMPSGDPAFWEIGIESQRVKDNAYKKQQDDKARRKSKEAYLDIVDAIEIIKQKNNWDFFEPIFNLPMSTDKKGNKYYLGWANNFNELRKIAAHKNSMRTYSDEDLDFLDWLTSELEPKIDAELKMQ